MRYGNLFQMESTGIVQAVRKQLQDWEEIRNRTLKERGRERGEEGWNGGVVKGSKVKRGSREKGGERSWRA